MRLKGAAAGETHLCVLCASTPKHAGVCKLLFLPSASFTGMAFALVLRTQWCRVPAGRYEKPHMCPPKGPMLAYIHSSSFFVYVYIMNALVFLFWRISFEKSIRWTHRAAAFHCPFKACVRFLFSSYLFYSAAERSKCQRPVLRTRRRLAFTVRLSQNFHAHRLNFHRDASVSRGVRESDRVIIFL